MAGINPGDIIAYAQWLTTQNIPYVWGGTGLSGMDCSGMIFNIAQKFGMSIPRGSRDQIRLGQQVGSLSNAQPGDLIGFDSEHDGTSEHIGMYIGNGQIIVADHPGTNVRINSISNEDAILGIVRLPGVMNLNGQAPSPTAGSAFASGTFSNLITPFGNNAVAAIPAARPTFDWWSGIGLKSPGLASADETYGLIDSFIRSDPELADLYSKAVAGTWSQDQFIASLQETNWWRTNSDSARQFLTMKNTDPAGWSQKVANKQIEIQDLAVKMGVHLSANGLQNMASTSLMLNQDSSGIKTQLANYLTMSQQGWYGGYAGQVELGLKAYAQDMGVPLDDAYVQKAVTGIVAGTDSLQAHRAFVQTQAEGAFPAYTKLIQDGMTVGQIAKPYLQTQAKLWEVDPNAVDLFDSTLRGSLQHKNPDGTPAVKQVYDFEKDLRKDPRWLKTNNSREALMAGTKEVLSNMGLLAGNLGNAPATKPNELTYIAPSTGNTGLSGATSFPTLQNQQALSTQNKPPQLQSATGLAPDNSFKPQG